MRTIRIGMDIKRRFYKKHYACIEGTKEENIICAMVVLFSNPNSDISPKDFVSFYNEMCASLKDGFNPDYSLQPGLRGSQVIKDFKSVEGKDLTVLNKETIAKIARYVSNNDPHFCTDVEIAFVESSIIEVIHIEVRI